MWIAQGFVRSSEEGKLMEDIAGEYFDELCWRSLLQEERHFNANEDTIFKMHDLIHDLARFIGGTECLIVDDSRIEGFPRNIRHLSSFSTKRAFSVDLMSFDNGENLRPFILSCRTFRKLVIPDGISSLTCLLVLDLSYTNIKNLPNLIGKLKHLRYLY